MAPFIPGGGWRLRMCLRVRALLAHAVQTAGNGFPFLETAHGKVRMRRVDSSGMPLWGGSAYLRCSISSSSRKTRACMHGRCLCGAFHLMRDC